MKPNMTFSDRMIRLIMAVVCIALYLNSIITGTVGIILIVLAIVFAATAAMSFCPIYTLLGIRKWEKKV